MVRRMRQMRSGVNPLPFPHILIYLLPPSPYHHAARLITVSRVHNTSRGVTLANSSAFPHQSIPVPEIVGRPLLSFLSWAWLVIPPSPLPRPILFLALVILTPILEAPTRDLYPVGTYHLAVGGSLALSRSAIRPDCVTLPQLPPLPSRPALRHSTL